MTENYKRIFKGDFGIVAKITEQIYIQSAKSLKSPTIITIHPFDFELMKIEINAVMETNFDKSKLQWTVMGLKVIRSEDCEIGTFKVY